MIIMCLPAFNEESAIGLLLERIEKAKSTINLPITIVVIDDGSTDNTRQKVREFSNKNTIPVKLVEHGKNIGLGNALRTALKTAMNLSKSKDDIIITMDADNTHDPSLMAGIANAVSLGSDLVIASRYQRGGGGIGLSLKRSILSKTASIMLKIIFPIKNARDYSSGFRGYRAEIIEKGFEHYGDNLIETSGFSCMAELLIKLRFFDIKVSEVPLLLRYDQKSGPSKMPVSRTIMQYIRFIGKNLFR